MAYLDAVYVKNDAFVFREIAGETILVPVYGHVADMESIYTLNGVGARVWALIDGTRTIAEIQEKILEEYDAPEEEIASDLQEFIKGLMSIEALRAA